MANGIANLNAGVKHSIVGGLRKIGSNKNHSKLFFVKRILLNTSYKNHRITKK